MKKEREGKALVVWLVIWTRINHPFSNFTRAQFKHPPI
jgi:hypothetical protein